MNDEREKRILRRLDDPWKIGLWEIDVAFPFMVCAFLGVLRGGVFALSAGVGLGAFLAFRITRLKAARLNGFFFHFIYWWFPPMLLKLKALPPSTMREMVG